MKPISLEMTAFGSYAEKTTVDFERLNDGLYLITGDTGAGKTTIFDAIMFALYNKASGERKTSMLHCDFVDPSVDTVVALKFLQGSKEYTVKRTIHFPKKRGTEGQFGEYKLDATLWEPGKDPIDGPNEVTERCVNLLGLTAEQFKKIVMLAQGKFKEFLDADGEKKNEILGKLFDNSAYIRYQELLKGARDALRDDRIEHTKCVEDTMRTFFQMPEGLEDIERDLYLPEHPELAENLKALTEADVRRLMELKEACEVCGQRKSKLDEQKGAAEGHNKLLDEQKDKKKRFKELENEKTNMVRLQADYDAAEKVLHQIQPKREMLDNAIQSLNRAGEEIRRLQGLREQQEEIVRNAQTAVDGDSGAKEEIQKLNIEIQNLRDTLPAYKELEIKQREKKMAWNQAQKARIQQADAQGQKEREQKEAEDLSKEQAGLAGIDARAVELRHIYEEARKNTEALAGKYGIQVRVYGVAQKEKNLAKQMETLKILTADAAHLEEIHHNLYQAFIGGQAGLLADELRQDLARYGAAECPVCHSRFHAGQDHSFAVLTETTPKKDEVDAAKRGYEKTEQARRKQEDTVKDLRASISAEKEGILRDTQALLANCPNWDALASGGYLDRQIAQFRQAEAGAKSDLEKAVKKQNRNRELAKLLEQKETRLKELEKTISGWEEELRKQELSAGRLDAVIEGMQKQLQYPDRESAEEQIRSLEKNRGRLQMQVDDHQQKLAGAEKRRNTIDGSLASMQGRLPELEQDKTKAKDALKQALSQNGFLTLEDADRALLPVGGRDGERWLREQQEKLGNYRRELENVKERLEALSKQTEGLAYTDLKELEEQIGQAMGAFNDADAAYKKQDKLWENHRLTAKRVSQAKAELVKSEQAWKRLDLLADLAVGTSGEGGKLSFARYVMGTVFREVLEMANRRLNIMSGGKYELIHQLSTDRKNAKAGLEVEVLDMATGKQRNSKTLSGGESFLVSLSLALGLSDVVQSHTGGRRLDALFIDEGFGSLDNSTLDMALDVLNQLTAGKCLVGIISHISKLEESIPQKIRVKNSELGSSLQLE